MHFAVLAGKCVFVGKCVFTVLTENALLQFCGKVRFQF